MADPRTFVLIGDFQDNITPALESINNTINSFKRNMASMATKKGGGYNDVTQSVGKLVSAQKHLKEAIEGVGAAAKSATQDLKEYKSIMGKVASAQYHVQKSGTAAGKAQGKFWQGASKDLEDYGRKMAALQRQTHIKPYKSLSEPGGRRGGAGRTMLPTGGATPPGGGPPRGGGGMGRSRHGLGDGLGEYMGTFAFGMELGQGLAQPITTAIFSGFQMGVGLMAKTMEYVQSSFAERVEDQMTDLQTAGGYYALSKRQKDPLFTSLQSAIRFTQETNLVMSRLASDLPGSTEDYVKVSKRIGDSVMRLVDQNEKGSVAYAQQLIAKGGLQEQYKNISLEGPKAREGAISVILGELTKKTVLAGFGGSTGRGGAAGPYGLPALMERLITQPETSMKSLNKYASVFGDPKIMAGLERAEEKLAKAGSNMLERAKVINEFLDEVVPPEMIAAMRKSMAGMMEAYRSAFFDPEMGLFGFGRKVEGLLQPMVNEFGQFVKEEVDANGKKMYRVVQTAGEASQVTLGVFEMFSDVVSNIGAIIKPIVDNLYLLWDPMEGLANVLKDVRIISTQLLGLFRSYDEALKQEVNRLGAETAKGKTLGMTRSLRASLLTIFDIFTDLGAISETDFTKYRAMIIDPTKGIKDLANLVQTAVTTFFDSNAGFNAGKFVGEMLREVAISLSEFTGFISQLGTTQLVQGFMAGFGKEGVKAVQKIFADIYKLLFEAAKAIIPLIPWQVYAAAAAGLVIPAAVAALGMAIGGGIAEMLKKMGEAALAGLAKGGKGSEVAQIVSNAMEGATDIAQGVAETTRRVAVTGGGKGPKGAPVTQSGGKGTSGRYVRSIREGAVTKSGVGITTSDDAVRGGAKVTESLLEPVKPSKLKNFLKGAVGADESLLGRKAVDLGKGTIGALKAPLASLAGALGALSPLAGKLKGLLSVIDEFTWGAKDALRLLVNWLSGEINVVGPALSKFGNYLIDIVEGVRNPFYGLTSAVQRLDDFIIRLIEGNIGFRDTVRTGAKGLAAGAKGIGVRIVGVAKNVATAAKGGLGGLLGGVKGAAGGLKGLFGKGLQGLGKFGTVATVGVGIVEALMALFSGASLGEALGKGAGPVLGTILGTALLGPLGGIIGGMIGSLEGITQPLGKVFDSIVNSFAPLTSVVGTFFAIIGDIGKMIASVFGVGTDSGFSGLAMVLEPIVKLFQLLEVGIRGLAVALKYVRMMITEWTGSEEEKLKARREFYAEDKALKERQGQMFAQENRSIADNEKERARIFAEYNEKAKSKMTAADSAYYQSFLKYNKLKLEEQYKTVIEQKTADAKLKGLSEERRKTLEEEVRQYKAKLAALKGEKPPATTKPTTTKPTTSTTSAKPKVGYLTKNGVQGWLGTDGSWTPLATPKVKTPSKPIGDGVGGLSKPVGGKPTVAKEVTQTAQNTNNINKKATDQIKATTNVKAGVDKTTQAVNNLAVKITPQTKLQTTTAAIYNLLASGTLRVLTNIKVPTPTQTPTRQTTAPRTQVPDTRSPVDLPPAQRNQVPAYRTPGGILLPPAFDGRLGDAISSELKNKPSGSDLVVANSSETIIPAAGGHGMGEFVDTLKWGFATMIGAFKQAQQKQDTLLNGINQTLKTNQQQTNSRLLAMEKKFTTPGMAGGLGGAAAGGVDAFTPIAQKYGLQMTSGYRPGDPGWHGANRARDFSNGTGPTPQMMQFAQYMASAYGANLKELIYTPLGFSIKNGQKVPPYAQGSHYNHVHVAYAAGFGNPAFFNDKEKAEQWEKKHLGFGVKSITTNTAELAQAGDGMMGPSWLPWNWGKLVDQERKTNKLNRTNQMLEQMQKEGYISPGSLYRQSTSSAGSAPINITAPITINQQPGQDADELASIVAMKIGEAVSDARAASIFV